MNFNFLFADHKTVYQEEQLLTKELTPMGQTCMATSVSLHNVFYLLLNKQKLPSTWQTLNITFSLSKLFGLNVTFRIFSLSDMCLSQQPVRKGNHVWLQEGALTPKCLSYQGSEYVTVNTFYFCFKRPQWSMFTAHIVNIVYSKCQICDKQESHIKFDYQVLDVGLYTTRWDEFNLVLFSAPQTFEEKLTLLTDSTSTHVKLFHALFTTKACEKFYIVKGHAYQNIILSHNKQNQNMKQYLVDSSNLNNNKMQIFRRQELVVNYHYCYVKVEEQQGSEKCELHNKHEMFVFRASFVYEFQNLPADKRELRDFTKTERFYHKTCMDEFGCRKLHKLYSNTSEYIQVNILKFHFSGLKVYSCLFGGVNFYENVNSDNRYMGRILGNTAVTGQKQTLTMCSHEIHHSPETGGFFPYTSSQSELQIVVHHQLGAIVILQLEVEGGTCKGTFVNFCSKFEIRGITEDTFPEFPKIDTMGTVRVSQEIFHYQFPFEGKKNDCITFQVGSIFFKDKPAHEYQHNRWALNEHCSIQYEMRDNVGDQWCGAHVSYAFFPHEAQGSLNTRQWESHLAFANTVLNQSYEACTELKKQSCAEHLDEIARISRRYKSSPWNRGHQMCSARRHQKISASVLFASKHGLFSSVSRNLFDYLHIRQKPRSESYGVLTYELVPCRGTRSQTEIPPRRFPLTSRSVCLRDGTKGILPTGLTLQMILANARPTQCELGKIQVELSQCVLKELLLQLSITDMIPLVRDNVVRQCVERRFPRFSRRPATPGRSRTSQWNADLRTSHFHHTESGVLLELPGKILRAELETRGQQCCRRKNCSLVIRVAHREEKPTRVDLIQDPAQAGEKGISFQMGQVPKHYFCRQLNCGSQQLQVRLYPPCIPGSFCLWRQGSVRHTWYDARDSCRRRDLRHSRDYGDLPVLLSQRDVDELIHFIRVSSFSRLITTFFIGLRRQVRGRLKGVGY